MMAYATIAVSVEDRVAWITLDRPGKLNSFTAEMRGELIRALDEIASDPSVRCLVLRGNGRAFSAGQDLGEREKVTRGEDIDLGAELEAGFNRIVRTIAGLSIPVLCGVHGVAAGAGANLALACDIVVVTPAARFIQSFARIGLVPDGGGTWTLPRLVGLARARGLALLGDTIDGATAAQWGLVWRCVADDELETELNRLSSELAGRSPSAVAATKAALRASLSNTLDEQLDVERDAQSKAGRTPEYRDSVAAFLAARRAR